MREHFEYNQLTRIFRALYCSEGWYDRWALKSDLGSKTPLYCKARAIVVFDRIMTNRTWLE